MSEDLVTVIIPAYRCEKVIASAIESVLGQTYKNIELIVVNDGSPDNVEGAVKKYRDNIRYVYQENGGVSKARNTGIKIAAGKYVAFLDADDTWDNKKLSIQVEILTRHPEIKMLFSGFHVTQNGKILRDKCYKNSFNFFKEYKYDIKEIFKNKSIIDINNTRVDYYWGNIYDRLFLGNFILPSSVIARRESILESGCFSDKLKVAEETEFFLRFASRNNMGFIDYPIVFYEMPSSDNLSGKSNMENLIKNAFKIQIDSWIANRDNLKKDAMYYMKGISNTYCRLAYYYLSELNKCGCRKYSMCAMKLYKGRIKPYVYYFASYFPSSALVYMANIKKSMK